MKLKPKSLEVEVRKAVLDQWDPIGVKDIEGAENEYDLYIAPICLILSSHNMASSILEYLWQIETQHMGLTGNRGKTEKFAETLMKIKKRHVMSLDDNRS